MPSGKDNILVIGSSGQIGTELVPALQKIYGDNGVIAADIKDQDKHSRQGIYETLNVMNSKRLAEVVKKYDISQIYLLAALLSFTAEKNPRFAWDLNMEGLFHVLNLAKEGRIKKIYWPSSIAVFGPSSPKKNAPQQTVMEPQTVYGISKLTGERWCEYYFLKYGVDVRSLRYPGLIGHESEPGGGTTDYAVEIFHAAIKEGIFTCPLSADTFLPMLYMPDAIENTIRLMEAPLEKVKIRSSYNLSGMSFSPAQLAAEIRMQIPGFTLKCLPDSRQKIADGWPDSINGSQACTDWGCLNTFGLREMTSDMIFNLRKKIPGHSETLKT